MKKSELYAKYMHFGNDVIEITPLEFRNLLDDCVVNGDKNHSFESDGSTEYLVIHTDGCDYYQYSSMFMVNGEYDFDQFFCKVNRITKAQMKEIQDLFTSM